MQGARYCQDCFSALGKSEICPNCGYDNAHPSQHAQSPLPPFTVLHQRYRLGHTLGAGGFGITYVAFDMLRNLKCAVKEYFPLSLASRDTTATLVACLGDPQEYQRGLSRFYREAQTLGTFNDCHAIVSVWDFFKEHNTAYMVMEFVQGNNLKIVMQENGGRIPYEKALDYLLQCAGALRVIHAKGVIHRDISPDNIILLPDNRIKLLDFGAAKQVRQEATSGVVFIKQEFAPPEQYSASGRQGPWTDVYALACTFYKLIAGVRVPEAAARNDGATILPLHSVDSHIPRHVSEAFEKAMAIPISERYQSMEAFIAALSPSKPIPPASPVLPTAPAQAAATVTRGAHAGASVILPDGVPIRVGRFSQYCELLPGEDPAISRIHCVLTYRADSKAVEIQDNSTNGTFLLNGTRLPYGKAYVLRTTQTICLASSNFQIKVVIP